MLCLKVIINQQEYTCTNFPTGSRYAYSNFGYTVLGRIIEQASGRNYDDYIRELLVKIGVYTMKIGRTRRAEENFAEVPVATH